MKRLLSRRACAVLLIVMTSSLAGMGLAVVAFGQDGGDPDATVPLGDYTGTTPAPASTTPLSPYTTTTPTVQTQTTATTKTSTTPTETGQSAPATTNGTTPSRTHGTRSVPAGGGELPSRATGRAPTKLAFTGGEPILLGAFGVMLMVSGAALQQRRRRRRASDL